MGEIKNYNCWGLQLQRGTSLFLDVELASHFIDIGIRGRSSSLAAKELLSKSHYLDTSKGYHLSNGLRAIKKHGALHAHMRTHKYIVHSHTQLHITRAYANIFKTLSLTFSLSLPEDRDWGISYFIHEDLVAKAYLFLCGAGQLGQNDSTNSLAQASEIPFAGDTDGHDVIFVQVMKSEVSDLTASNHNTYSCCC